MFSFLSLLSIIIHGHNTNDDRLFLGILVREGNKQFFINTNNDKRFFFEFGLPSHPSHKAGFLVADPTNLDSTFNIELQPVQDTLRDGKQLYKMLPVKKNNASASTISAAQSTTTTTAFVTSQPLKPKPQSNPFADNEIPKKDTGNQPDQAVEKKKRENAEHQVSLISGILKHKAALLITIGASTGMAVAAAYAADWYNKEMAPKKEWSKINRRHAAAIAWIITAIAFSSYFYCTTAAESHIIV